MNGNGNPARRRVVVRERRQFQIEMQRLVEFVDNELGNGGEFQRPDDTEWKIQRRKTVRKLNELRRKLDEVCISCNLGKGVGDTAEITGASASVIGALMALAGSPLAGAVMNGGNIVQTLGNFVEGASIILEALLSNEYLSEVQAVLERDQELSRPLMDWLVTSANLDATIRVLFGCDLTSAKLSNVLKTFYEFSRLFSSGKSFQTTLDLMNRGRYSVHLGTDVQLEYLQNFCEHLGMHPALGDTIRTSLSVLSGSVRCLQVGRNGVSIHRFLMGKAASLDLASLRGGINPEIPTFGEVSTFCVFQTINIAANIVSLTNLVRVIAEGKSKYSDGLKQLSDLLEDELRGMEAQ